MFEFKTIVTQPTINLFKFCHASLRRDLPLKRLREKTTITAKNKSKNFTAKTHISVYDFRKLIKLISLKAPSKKVKLQSDKVLTTQIYYLLTAEQMGFFLNETR